MPWPKSHSSHSEQENWPWNPEPWFLDQVSLPFSLVLLPWEGRELAGGRWVQRCPEGIWEGKEQERCLPSSSPCPDPVSRSSGYHCQDRG